MQLRMLQNILKTKLKLKTVSLQAWFTDIPIFLYGVRWAIHRKIWKELLCFQMRSCLKKVLLQYTIWAHVTNHLTIQCRNCAGKESLNHVFIWLYIVFTANRFQKKITHTSLLLVFRLALEMSISELGLVSL